MELEEDLWSGIPHDLKENSSYSLEAYGYWWHEQYWWKWRPQIFPLWCSHCFCQIFPKNHFQQHLMWLSRLSQHLAHSIWRLAAAGFCGPMSYLSPSPSQSKELIKVTLFLNRVSARSWNNFLRFLEMQDLIGKDGKTEEKERWDELNRKMGWTEVRQEDRHGSLQTFM